MNAFAWTFFSRGDDIGNKVQRDASASTGFEEQLVGLILDVRQPIQVHFKHWPGVLHAQAIASAQLLVDPYFKSGVSCVDRIGIDESLLHEVGDGEPNNHGPIPLDRLDLELTADTADETLAH